jgi:predicted ATPase
MERFVTISGCSGGGKSTLLVELRRRGYATVQEPGRRIVAQEMASGGRALPWIDAAAFARRAIDLSLADLAAAEATSSSLWVFFDRGLIDAGAAFEHVTGERVLQPLGAADRYSKSVFLAPPWPEIYVTDEERRHDFAEAVEEYTRLKVVYPSLGYRICELPKVGRRARRPRLVYVTCGPRIAPVPGNRGRLVLPKPRVSWAGT